jgi:hypothetical protein
VSSIDEVRNPYDGKRYRIVTSNTPPLKVWRTVVFGVGFIGISKAQPLLLLVSRNKVDAETQTHTCVKRAIEKFDTDTWKMDEEMIDDILELARSGDGGWSWLEQIRTEWMSMFQ